MFRQNSLDHHLGSLIFTAKALGEVGNAKAAFAQIDPIAFGREDFVGRVARFVAFQRSFRSPFHSKLGEELN